MVSNGMPERCESSPQAEEKIEKAEWFTRKKASKAFGDTYNSIKFVWETYVNLNEKISQ